MHYYVVGVNGSGKTSLLQAIAAETGIAVVHGTTELMRYLGIPGDYHALRALNQDEVLSKWAETAKNLITEYGTTPFLLDTHLLNLTHGNVIRRDGDWIADYDALVLVKANPSTILARVQSDSNKDRALFRDAMIDSQKLAMLEQYQNQTEQLFQALSATYHLPSLVIQNDSTIEAGVAAFIDAPIHR